MKLLKTQKLWGHKKWGHCSRMLLVAAGVPWGSP